MTLPEVGMNQPLKHFPQDIHAQRQVTAARLDEDSEKAKGQRERASSPIQDQVTLSKEAQALAASNNPTSRNNSFQQSPSPFDR